MNRSARAAGFPLAFLSSLAIAQGCTRKPPPDTKPVATATAAPTKVAPPFVAPASLPAGDTYVVTDVRGTIRIDTKGVVKHDERTLGAIARSRDGNIYGTTWSTLYRRDAKNGWVTVAAYGNKVSSALMLVKRIELAVGPGAEPIVTVLGDEYWSGKMQKNMVMVGTTISVSPKALDGSGILWGGGIEKDELYRIDGLKDPQVISWARHPIRKLVGRADGGVVLMTDNAVQFGAETLDKTVELNALAKDATLGVGPTGTIVIRSGDTLVFVSPDGGVTTVKQKGGDVLTVDGRSRVWTAIGDELHVIDADGKNTVVKGVSGMGIEKAIAIVTTDGGADIK